MDDKVWEYRFSEEKSDFKTFNSEYDSSELSK